MNTSNTIPTYPQIQAIEPTASHTKYLKGLKTGRNLFIGGIVIAAGLSNGLSGLDVIREYTFGWYGGLIAFGIIVTLIGLIVMFVNGVKMQIRDNPNLVENSSSSMDDFDDRIKKANDDWYYYYSPSARSKLY